VFSFLTNPIKRKQYLLMAGDALIVLAAILLAYVIRFTLEGVPLSTIHQRITWMIPGLVAVHLLTFYVLELYDLSGRFTTGRGGVAVLGGVLVSWGGVSILSFLVPACRFGRVVLVLYVSLAAPAAFLWRVWFFKRLLQVPRCRNLLLVGADLTNGKVKEKLEKYPIKEYNLVGVVNGWGDCAEGVCPELVERTCRDWENLAQVVREKAVDTVVYSVNDGLSNDFLNQVLALRFQGIEVYDIPRFYSQLEGKIPAFAVNATWLLNSIDVNPYLSSPLKRVLDLFLAVVGLVLLSPLLLFIGLIIKLDSRGPVLFRQERVGRYGKPFIVCKFRTMVQDAEAAIGPVWARKNDPRVTRVGGLLRKTRLDELPQLINVLKGEMSFVGPRPIREYFEAPLREEIPFYFLRHCLRPGVTGWAQVKEIKGEIREERGPLERFEYDLFYTQNASPALDMYIVLKTVQTVLFRPSQ
jgi:exopolysaccharide biosynthesis polyprenyl glycosylphosphotransferase